MSQDKRSGFFSSWQKARTLPRGAWYLLGGIGLAKMAAYMIWPFIAVMMNRRFGLPITEIGAVLSAGIFLSILLSPISGYLGDKLNRRLLMLVGGAMAIGAYLMMLSLPSATSYFAAILAMAVANSLLEPLLRATLGEQVTSDEDKAFLFHLRYYLVNLAVAIGPLAGIWFAEQENDLVFVIAIFAYCLLCLAIALKGHMPTPQTQDAEAPRFRHVLATALRHRAFMIVMAVNLMLCFIYAMMEDPLTLYLIDLEIEGLNKMVGLLNFTNTAVVLAFHLFLMGWLTKLKEGSAYMLALLFLTAAMAVTAANQEALPALWLLAIGLATLGEIVVMPLITVLIDKLAPQGMRGSFFGLSMLAGLGAAAAPVAGAFIINLWGGTYLFLGLAILCLPVGLVGYLALRRDSTNAPALSEAAGD